jgi:hypothetical protein
MPDEHARPFETIESALEFMVLLEDVIAETSADLQGKRHDSMNARYKNGLDLALYKVHQLSSHVQKSRRILNDLSLIRRVLFADGHLPATSEAGLHHTKLARHPSELLRLAGAHEKTAV